MDRRIRTRAIKSLAERIIERRPGPDARVRAKRYAEIHRQMDVEVAEHERIARERKKQERLAAREAAE